jgi:hypothetical protein
MTKHVKHSFIGEREGNALAEWLNQKKHGAERGKVMEIISAIGGLDAALGVDFHTALDKAAKKARGAGRRSFTFGGKVPPSRQYLKIVRRVDRLLSDCWMRPRLDLHSSKPTFIWKYQKPRSEGVHLLTQIMEMGLMDRIRTCAKVGCGKWFFAKFQAGRYCGRDCQRRDYQTSEEWKGRRRSRYRARKVR